MNDADLYCIRWNAAHGSGIARGFMAGRPGVHPLVFNNKADAEAKAASLNHGPSDFGEAPTTFYTVAFYEEPDREPARKSRPVTISYINGGRQVP